MNKNIKIEIAIGVILAVASLLGGLLWLNGKELKQDENRALNQPSTTQQLPNNNNSKSPDAQQTIPNPENNSFDCKENEQQFITYSAKFFGGKDYSGWCEDCKKNNGKPQISHDVGPFCNIKTSDSGKNCTDSKQCEGHCIAKEKNDTSGTCTAYKELSNGCGWLEVNDGRVRELCID